ncbi:MAG: hypothetical protein DCC65_07460 [Planctomycetota bacterium]|nr:MAG: hypothetical protein DCC65_07460 [Planctomycetota bacterium]
MSEEPGPPPATQRFWIGVLFECCGVYARIYRKLDVKCYSGRCPKCQREVTVKVGAGGTADRLFRARPPR